MTWKTSGPPGQKLRGLMGTQGLLSATFCDWRCNGEKTKRTSNTAKTLGLHGVKVVSAEGIESTLKRRFNNIEGNGRRFRQC